MFLTIRAAHKEINKNTKLLIEKLRLWELKKFIKRKYFSLLDLGCGDGTFINLSLQNNINAWGVDKISSTHPRVTSTKIENFKSNRKFDVITMFHVLEHLEKPRLALIKIKSLLKKDGVLVIEVPLVGNLTEKFLKKDYFAYSDSSHIHFFTKKQLFQLLQESGFIIQKQGFTLYEFPFSLITAGFKKGIAKGLWGTILFLPLKISSVLRINEEIIRLYCLLKH